MSHCSQERKPAALHLTDLPPCPQGLKTLCHSCQKLFNPVHWSPLSSHHRCAESKWKEVRANFLNL